MVVLIVESVSPSLRGELSKWMLEPKAGVFVGRLAASVRDLLWEKACAAVGRGGCTMIYRTATEQGFAIRSYGDTSRLVEKWDGLYLVRRLPRLTADVLASAPTAMRLWAKANPLQPLPCHLVDVGHVAVALLETSTFQRVAARFVEAADCPQNDALHWLGYLVALHDWGKGWRNFQSRAPEMALKSLKQTDLEIAVEEQEAHIRHERISRLWVEEHLREWGQWDRRSRRTVGAAIELHHGRVSQPLPVLPEFPGRDAWEKANAEVERLVRIAFQPSPWQASFRDHSTVGVLLAGLIVWSDWIASNEELFPLRWQGEAWLDYVELSQTAARDAVARLGLSDRNPWQAPRSFAEMWPFIDEPRTIQQACIDLVEQNAEPGLVIIEAPTGEGKSEAAMFLAAHWMKRTGGFYVGLPTAATSNQMFTRMRRFLQDNDPAGVDGLQLVHGAEWLVDRATPQQVPDIWDGHTDDESAMAYDWFRPRKRTLLATYGVGTVDQVLMSVLHVKFGFLRLFGLTGKVLVIDEVHAYDAYMNEILDLLLAWCRTLNIPVILLSATLPESRRRQLVAAYLGKEVSDLVARGPKPVASDGSDVSPYPLITHASTKNGVRHHRVAVSDRTREIRVVHHRGLLGRPERIADLVLRRMADGGCLCVLANTVASAQDIYEELKRRDRALPVLLFHARFLAGHRQRVEERALAWFDKRSLLPVHDRNRTERPGRAVLVATQVVEQSLDLDFDEMISEIAPIDLLLQRAGRLHRHERPDRRRAPAFHVLLPEQGSDDYGPSGRVYAPYVLSRTEFVLETTWRLPEQFRPLIESVYGPEPTEKLSSEWRERLAALKKKWEAAQEKAAKAATRYLIPPPDERVFRLDRMAQNVFEEDDGLQTYFSAKTRYGDATMRVLVQQEDRWRDVLGEGKLPPRRVKQEMLLHTVALPRWWFKEAKPQPGWDEMRPAPRWFAAEAVLPVRGGVWAGVDGRNRAFRVVVDEELGVRLQTEGGVVS